mgnify:CR=1 FL=1
MRKIVNLLRFGSTYLRLVRDTGRLDLVFALADSLTDNPSPGLQKMLALPDVRAYLARDIKPLRIELPVLRRMPEGSLGRVFAAFLDQRGLDPTGLYHSGDEAASDAARFRLHMERTHDLWHTVLGYDTDVASELGLQAFSIAQIGSGLGYVILSGGLLNSLLFAPEDGPRRMEAIARGWNLGKTTRPLFGADWEKMLTWPIEQVRARFGIRDADLQTAAMAA